MLIREKKGKLAPIILFTYKRLTTLKLTISALQKNTYADECELFIFSDYSKTGEDTKQVLEVREYLKTVTGFKNVIIYQSDYNKGLSSSIIDGVTRILNIYGKVIVLEDDLLTSNNFLNYMNDALDFYQNNASVISISGYNMAINAHRSYPYDVFFAKRSASWGWATWLSKWEGIDWDVTDFDTFSLNKKEIKLFNRMGSDMFSMLKKQQMGLNNSWAIRYCYHQHKYDLYSVFPVTSKVRNIGFDGNATNTVQKYNRFDTSLDTTGKGMFTFATTIVLDRKIMKQFVALNGYRNRIKSKLRELIIKISFNSLIL